MEKLNCLVIDDEPLAGKGLSEYISEIAALNLIGVVQNATEAVALLPQVQLMFLDINMPRISGIDFLKQLQHPPLTIITTAYPQYALEGYELDVIDYLLKPISFQRFLKATTKVIDYYSLNRRKEVPGPAADYFFVKSNGILEKVMLEEIIAVESLSNYIIIHCIDRKLIVYLTLKQILESLPESFIQVHKSFIVSIPKISRIEHDELRALHLNIPIGMNYKEAVMERVVNNRILKR